MQALTARAAEIAKGWVVELVERTPLQHTRGALIEDTSAYVGGWVELVCAALGDDAALERLAAHGLVPVIDASPTESLRSLDALQATLWAVALDELRSPDPRVVAEVAERLGRVMESLRAVVADGWESEEIAKPGAPGGGIEPAPEGGRPRANREHVLLAARLRAASGEGAAPTEAAPPAKRRAAKASRPDVGAPSAGRGASGPARSGAGSGRTRDRQAPGAPSAASGPTAETELPLQGGLWVRVLEDEIRQARLGAQRLALILVELEDVERLQATADPPELEVLLGRYVETLRSVIRREDILALESWGKAWIVSPGTGRFTARLVAGGVADELAHGDQWQGAPLRASAGIAVLDEDGEDAEGLIEAAEQERFTASSQGLAVVEAR